MIFFFLTNAVIGVVVGVLLLLIVTWWLYKVIRKHKNTQLKEKLFKRNGGLLLQQQLHSSHGSVHKTKIFSSNELEKATDCFSEKRVLGQGGQGTIYKGMLANGKIIAVKKSKKIDKGKIKEFINEVVILSQINHRNVMRLLGCCLEIEVPLLVYELISSGTLFQHLHDQNEEFSLSSSIHNIKSTNILLDEK